MTNYYNEHSMLTVLLGTGGSVDNLSRIGCRPFFTASVSVNSGLTSQHNTQTHNNSNITVKLTVTRQGA